LDSLLLENKELAASNDFGDLFINFSALKTEYIRLKDTNRIVTITLRMADASRGGGSHSEALDILNRLENSNYFIKPHHQIGLYLIRGSIYYEISEHEKAIFWASKGMALADKYQKRSYVPLLYNLLGASYTDINPDSSLKYIQKSVDLFLQSKDTAGVALPYINMAHLFWEGRENEKAKEVIFKALAILDKMDVPIYRKMAYTFLSILYDDEKDYKNTVKYLKLRDSVNYEINNDKITFQLNQFQEKLQQQKAETEKMYLQAQVEIAQYQRQKYIIYTTIGLVAILALGLTLFFTIRNSRRRNKLHQESLVRVNRLAELDHFKNKVLSVISHDMRAPLAQVITFHQAKNSGVNFSEDEMKEMDKTILASTQSGLLILDNLLKWARSQIDGLKVNNEPFDSFFAITQILNQVSQLSKEKEIQLSTSLAQVEIVSDEGLFQIVLRNLLSNAIKFSPTNSEIRIESFQNDGSLYIKITDQGPGIPETVIQALNESAEIKAKTGSFGEKGAGIGLTLSKEFAKKAGGTLAFSRSTEGGTVAIFQIALSNGK
tara:strand:+ start:9756 stop:11399 length:1644 start_codon:yes stop_codon:yes gene_type:complete